MGYISIMTSSHFNMKPNPSDEFIKWCVNERFDHLDPQFEDYFKAYGDFFEEWMEIVAKNADDGSWFILRGEEGEQDKAILRDGEWEWIGSKVLWEDDPLYEELDILRRIYDILKGLGDLQEPLGVYGRIINDLQKDMSEIESKKGR